MIHNKITPKQETLMDGEPARYSVAESTHLVLPMHANLHGTLFGGQLVAWLDLVATLSAMRHTIHPVVTASIEDLHFLHPIFVGQAIALYAKPHAAFHSSIEIGVSVHSFSPEFPHEKQLCCKGVFVFVALDEKGRPVPIRPLIIESDEEKLTEQAAKERKKRRQQQR